MQGPQSRQPNVGSNDDADDRPGETHQQPVPGSGHRCRRRRAWHCHLLKRLVPILEVLWQRIIELARDLGPRRDAAQADEDEQARAGDLLDAVLDEDEIDASGL